jgi:hypothetical protein
VPGLDHVLISEIIEEQKARLLYVIPLLVISPIF